MMLQPALRRLGQQLSIRGSVKWSPTTTTITPRNYTSTPTPHQAGSEFIFSRLNESEKITPIIAKLQQECWDGYVSTGRGCHTLFQLLDTDSSGQISWQEIRFFLVGVLIFCDVMCDIFFCMLSKMHIILQSSIYILCNL